MYVCVCVCEWCVLVHWILVLWKDLCYKYNCKITLWSIESSCPKLDVCVITRLTLEVNKSGCYRWGQGHRVWVFKECFLVQPIHIHLQIDSSSHFDELLTRPFFGPKICVLFLRISIEIIYNINTEWENGNSAQQNQRFCFMNKKIVHGSESWFFFRLRATENFVTQISQSWYAGKS